MNNIIRNHSLYSALIVALIALGFNCEVDASTPEYDVAAMELTFATLCLHSEGDAELFQSAKSNFIATGRIAFPEKSMAEWEDLVDTIVQLLLSEEGTYSDDYIKDICIELRTTLRP